MDAFYSSRCICVALVVLTLIRSGFAQQDDILIGEFASLTGSTAVFGQSAHDGIQLAIEEANARGGVLHKQIKLITEDDQSKSEDAVSAVNKLISHDHVVALLGEVASSRTFAGGAVAQISKIPMISPASTNAGVLEIGDFVFRACFNDAFQGTAMAAFAAKSLHAKKAVVLTDVRQDYCMTLANSFSAAFSEDGCEIVSQQAYSSGDRDFSQIIKSIEHSHPDVIYIPGYYDDVSLFVRQVRDHGLMTPILGGDGWDSPELTRGLEKAFNNTYFSNHFAPDDPNERVQTFVTNYKKRFGQEPTSIAALGYDAAGILIDAISRAKGTDSISVRNSISSTKDFSGVTGTITIDQNRNSKKPLTILRIVDGKNVFAQNISAAARP
ncbi:MAG: ABC transporter substrate-binding protein, partial [Bacteroidota bacterium]|nr:ABC transporter substrate-binding protein [Bacteroidota bacterium]